MYGSGGNESDCALLAAMGVPPERWPEMLEKAVTEIWPGNWPAFQVFSAMTTQWRVGMGGATGLDYAVLPTVMDIVGIRKKARRDVFAAVREMENEALAIFAERNKRAD